MLAATPSVVRFDETYPRAHASWICQQFGDWPAVRAAVEAERAEAAHAEAERTGVEALAAMPGPAAVALASLGHGAHQGGADEQLAGTSVSPALASCLMAGPVSCCDSSHCVSLCRSSITIYR
jgi:hypothetical protein